ncbi:MAG TPA: GGDEF domain-containing protein [Gemmatimonadales bacterium]|jgi:diguanylate cyclase (GGDEF)-like protein|nr:GGDEF domain-containing protein [Gemmatimonadales bacterium]
MPSAGNFPPVQERRSGLERRSGADRREAEAMEEAAILPLQRVFPHARLSESEAAERAAAIEAHRRELGSRLGRNVGAVVAAVDYMLNISGDLVSPTIVEHEALERLEHRSVTDPLTGLFNRYHFDATMTREIARCRRYGVPLSLLLIDVDRLKLMNDRWGHHAGDQALSRVAIAIQKSLRGTDIAARLGGDEFAIILPDTDAVAGLIVASRIRHNLVENASTMVTVSGGLVELPRHALEVSAPQLMLVADHALYAAKNSGGNCVVQREYLSDQ